MEDTDTTSKPFKEAFNSTLHALKRLYKSSASLSNFDILTNQDLYTAREKYPLLLPLISASFCEAAEALILKSAEHVVQNDLDLSLWKYAFYRHIEEFRKRLKAPSDKTDWQVRFKHWLRRAIGFYEKLVGLLCQHYGMPCFSLGFGINGAFGISLFILPGLTPVVALRMGVQNNLAILLYHRILINLGDLTRYQQQYGRRSSSSGGKYNWDLVRNYYYLANYLVPENGMPHNQLGVLANYEADQLSALFHFYRSLTVANPVKTPTDLGRDNLRILFGRAEELPPEVDLVDTSILGTRDAIDLAEKVNNEQQERYLCRFFVHIHALIFKQQQHGNSNSEIAGRISQFQGNLVDLCIRRCLQVSTLNKLVVVNLCVMKDLLDGPGPGPNDLLRTLNLATITALLKVANHAFNRAALPAHLLRILPAIHLWFRWAVYEEDSTWASKDFPWQELRALLSSIKKSAISKAHDTNLPELRDIIGLPFAPALMNRGVEGLPQQETETRLTVILEFGKKMVEAQHSGDDGMMQQQEAAAGKEVAGKEVAGKEVAGKEVAGKEVADKEVVADEEEIVYTGMNKR